MIGNIKKYKFHLFLKKIEINFFYLSAIFLPSALPISVLFLLISITSFLLKDIKNIKKNQTNYLFILTAVFMIISSIISYYKFDSQIFNSYWLKSITTNTTKENIFLDLFNWIPLIFLYFTSQKYLQNIEGRIKFSRNILIGTIPVIISCFLQYWFKLYGPFKFLFGSIVWFQKPLEGNLGVSGLFSNQNYAGSWLATILPFSIFLILKNKNKFKKIFSSFITSTISYLIILTNSRNALIGLIFCIDFKILFIFNFDK